MFTAVIITQYSLSQYFGMNEEGKKLLITQKCGEFENLIIPTFQIRLKSVSSPPSCTRVWVVFG